MTPDFREVVGEDLSPEERARLERVHDLLVTAGPPPELPPALAEPAKQFDVPVILPRRRIGAMLGLAAALALAAFLGGYLAGHTTEPKFEVVISVPMHGVGDAQAASGRIDIGTRDSQGNWPLRVDVRNLPQLQRNGYYEMFLTSHGKIAATCGTFGVKSRNATVRLNAPYNLKRFDGWVVTREGPGSAPRHDVILET
jgi:hypothetical protein